LIIAFSGMRFISIVGLITTLWLSTAADDSPDKDAYYPQDHTSGPTGGSSDYYYTSFPTIGSSGYYTSFPTIGSSAPCTNGNGNELEVYLVTDRFASETAWKVTNGDNMVVMSNGELVNEQTYTTTKCLSPDCEYTFLIVDSATDGLCCNYGLGSVTVSLGGAEIFVASDFGYSASHNFCVEGTIDVPTKSPTAAPTPSPTVPCIDAGFPMAFTDYGASAVECNLIAALASECLCSDMVVQSHCPLACDSCDIYKCVDSAASWITPSGSVATCTALDNLSSADLDNFCGLSSQLRTTCPATCGVCD